MTRRLPLVIAVVLAPVPAFALQPAKHGEIAETACLDAGLPAKFCARAGKQAFETDYHEWDDLRAHAQRTLGQARCDAADGVVARVDQLGRAFISHARADKYEDAAIELGRALHTIQDECAHHGMTNEEHAHYSLTEVCTDHEVSPDSQPAAIACAEARTREVMGHVATALASASWRGVEYVCYDWQGTGMSPCWQATLPSPKTGCEFLAMHDEWDGVDSSWNGDVGPKLVTAFGNGMAQKPFSPPVCATGPNAIDPVAPHATVTEAVDVCRKIEVACLGKVDEGLGETPGDRDAVGCAAGGSPGWLLAAGLLLLRRRRR
jgi:hypothetical protein